MGGRVGGERIVDLASLVVGGAAIVLAEKRAGTEIAGQFGGRRNQNVLRVVLAVTKPLVGKEEECLVSAVVEFRNPNWPADRRAELVLPETRSPLGWVEEGRAGGKSRVPHVLPHRTMEIIRPRLGNNVHHAAEHGPKLGAVGV